MGCVRNGIQGEGAGNGAEGMDESGRKKSVLREFSCWGIRPLTWAVLEGITENNAKVRISGLTKKLSRNIREHF